jgi:hypothetical protein
MSRNKRGGAVAGSISRMPARVFELLGPSLAQKLGPPNLSFFSTFIRIASCPSPVPIVAFARRPHRTAQRPSTPDCDSIGDPTCLSTTCCTKALWAMRYVPQLLAPSTTIGKLLTRHMQVFKVILQPDTIGSRLQEVQKAVQDLDKFGKTVELVGLAPFQGTQDALQEINDISEGILSDFLRATLETNLPKAGKKKTITIGISEKNLAGSIKAAFPNLSCETSDTSEVVADLLRGLRQHSGKLIKKLQPGDIDRSILGLGHAYSRAKVKFSVQKQDNHIIQAIATLDQIDKDVCIQVQPLQDMS